jgi:DNA recombination protein RmuC
VRDRVTEITTRSYIDPETTVDCVLLFIPNEGIYSFVHEHDTELVEMALGHRVILCSPFTLFAVLGVVRKAVDSFVLDKTSDEILTCLGGFEAEWQKFSDQVDKVGRQLDSAHKSFESLAGTRRRQLERQLERVDDLRSRRGIEVADPAEGVPVLREVSAG